MLFETSQSIQKLEIELGFALPLAYRKHILLHGLGSPIVGTDCAPEDIVSNTNYLPDLLKENGLKFDLPKKLVCFLMHQGYIAAWFDAEDGDDPACWFFSEGSTPEPIQQGKFSIFMEKIITEWG